MEAQKFEIISEDKRQELENQLFLMDLNSYMVDRYKLKDVVLSLEVWEDKREIIVKDSDGFQLVKVEVDEEEGIKGNAYEVYEALTY